MRRRSAGALALIVFLSLLLPAPWLLAQNAPALSLKQAVDAAEKALTDRGVALDQYFLYSVTLQNDSSGDYWKCTFRPVGAGDKAGYGQIFVKVYMDGTAEADLPELPVRYRR